MSDAKFEAMFYRKMKDGSDTVQCELCPRNCKIAEGKVGFCRVRKNEKGTLYSVVFGKPCSAAVDPIEKKPLFHFAPGSECLSVATVGCNLLCKFCQNSEISQPRQNGERSSSNGVFGQDMPPEKLVSMNFTPGFAWTYTEPTIFYEYFYETAMLCEKLKKNLYHVWVSNGYTSPEPIKKAAKLLHAVNVDYKGDDNLYQKLCSAKLEHVQQALLNHKKAGVWIEVTNLLIPDWNDSEKQIKDMCEWISSNLGQVPMHFSRYFPSHRMLGEPTPPQTLEKAVEIADKFFDFVYIGNIRSDREHTYCPNCKKPVIKRSGHSVARFNLVKKGKDYHCPECARKIPLTGMEWSSFGASANTLAR
jgi:pyruvate formate lyase activating enzyme